MFDLVIIYVLYSFIFFIFSSDKSQNVAHTSALSVPVLIRSLEVRWPSTALIASIIIDFPAPVSPVNTLKPSVKSTLVFSITAILETDIILIDEVLSVGDIKFKEKSFNGYDEE